jgi:thermostable 8-oxoguanine DNA glycosylase
MAGPGVEKKPLEPKQLAWLYMTAKERVIEAGFADEIDWQEEITFADLDETTFLRESAWVVLSAGFREAMVRRRFREVSRAFFNWSSAELIMTHREICRFNALIAFRNQQKIDAILGIVERVAAEGIGTIRKKIENRGIEFIRELPFMGPITSCHLAKNLGVVIVKPDRHLTRIAVKTGYKSAERMCRTIAEVVGDSLSVIDIVIWRYATITNTYKTDIDAFDSLYPASLNSPALV